MQWRKPDNFRHGHYVEWVGEVVGEIREDYAAATLRYDSYVMGTLEASFESLAEAREFVEKRLRAFAQAFVTACQSFDGSVFE
ncbi:MAG: hypothetical protein ACKO0Z_25170 [Betaproteobacteria bacterium]